MRKVLSLACAIGLSATLFAGCGVNNAADDTTRANNATRFGTTVDRNNVDRGTLIGRGVPTHDYGTDMLGGRTGTGAGMTGYGATGLNGRGMTGTAGRAGGFGMTDMLQDENTLVIGNMVIVAANQHHGARGTRGANGTDGIMGGTAGTNGIMGGTTGTAGMTGAGRTAGTTGNGGNMGQYFGAGTNVLQVTDRKAVNAMKRVKARLNNTNGKITNADQISSDIELILKQAKPMNRGANAGNRTNNR
ncbi:hypothetical protein [Paenibacillus alkalitolerans]|uniref:hypothetical protein n=1 Tax=Paenibacillus alkalitolerans TaxID=2799335 RepID=UPI0018F3A9DB|nr:hypothetical protein [Paenibacillus alkalitolerans]